MCYIDSYKIKDYKYVVYTNLDAVPDTVSLRKTMIRNPKGWRAYRKACKTKLHDIGKSVWYKNTIYVACKRDHTEEPRLQNILKGLKGVLKQKWDTPLVIPVYLTKLSLDEFKDKVKTFNIQKNILIFTDEI